MTIAASFNIIPDLSNNFYVRHNLQSDYLYFARF